MTHASVPSQSPASIPSISIRATCRAGVPIRVLIAAVAAAALAACGGGGGGGGQATTQQPPPPPANQAPEAEFSVSNTDGLAPLEVVFDAGAAADPDGTIASYRWDFGDDTVSTGGPEITHTFQDTGAFTVTLRVTDDGGATDTASRPVRVRGATVSGLIGIGAGSAVDSDVNDRFTTPVDNNEPGTAQAVSNPVRLGGFVNLPGTGSSDGNHHATGDPSDYFFVELEGDERIVLSIAEPTADLDLEIYSDDPIPDLLDASISPEPGEDQTEDLQAPGPGNYFIHVKAVDGPTNVAGASNYVLSISDDSLLSLGGRRIAKRLSDPFVPGELLMAGGPRERIGLYAIHGSDRDRRFRMATPNGTRTRSPLVLPEVMTTPGTTIDPSTERRYRTLLAARQARREGIEVAEVNVLRQPLDTVPNDEFYANQWHYPEIGLEQAWDLTTGREPGNPVVVVAVVDTGVLLNHPDLRNQLLRDDGGGVVGFDFIRDTERANDGDGLDPNPDDPGDDGRGAGQGSFHGTHVAGTVAAESNNGIGVAGVSWEAKLMPLRALGVDGGTTFDVMQAIRYAARLSNISGTVPPIKADIVNLSLGSDFFSETEQRTIEDARAAGVILVASAGNDGSSVPSYPAAYDGVVAVGATTIGSDDNDRPAPYSNVGPHIDLAAPGGDMRTNVDNGVVSTIGSGGDGDIEFGYAILQGTSMAAPHVSGVVALMKALYPALTPAELDALLQEGELTDDAGPAGRDDQFGWGILNAFKAVQAAHLAQGGEQPTLISVSEGSLDFQAFDRELRFEVSKVGDDPVAVSLTDDQPWLTVAAESTTSDGIGRYVARVDRTGLADDAYTATITVAAGNPDVSDRSIRVTMQVTSPDLDADAGQHYVVLVRSTEDESLAAQIVTAANGEYTFALQDVPPGEYRLFAGTDHDDDEFICDGGEACGAFPSLSSPAVISVDARTEPELTGQDFMTEYSTTASPTAAASADEEGIAMTRPETVE